MKTRKRLLAGLGLALGLAWTARPAAATGTAQDAVTVTITPVASYLLLVSTGGPIGGLNLGTVASLVSTFTVNPTTVTVYSSYAQTGIQLEGLLSGGMTLEETDTANLPTDSDKLAVWAVFSDTAEAGAPATAGTPMPSANFQGSTPATSSSTLVTSGFVNVGGTQANKKYVLPKSNVNSKMMAGLPAFASDPGGSMSHLWLGLEMSPVATQTGTQSLTVVMKGVLAF